MTSARRRDNNCFTVTAPQKMYSEQDGYISTLHPEGSYNNIQINEIKRELYRPDIDYLKAVINVFTPLIIGIGVSYWDIRIAYIFICLYILVRLCSIMIWIIRIYQRYAPEEIRLSCVFEPSCSEYMILSIKKYGVIQGSIKGIKRLKRCHFPNGGTDYP